MSRGPLRLLRDFAALSGGELLAKLAGFGAFAYLARVLGPSPYGAVELAVAVVTFAALIVDFGFGPVGAREITRDRRRAEPLAAGIPAARLLLAGLAFGVVFAASLLLADGADTRRLIQLFGLSLFALPWTLNWLLQSTDRMAWVGLAQPLRMGLFLLGVLVLVRGGDDLWRVGLLETVAAVAFALYFLGAQLRLGIAPRLRFDRGAMRALFREAAPVGSSQLLWAANQYLPTVLVASLVGGAAVGWFGGSLRIVVSLGTFVWLYFFNLYPSLVRSAEEPRARYRALIAPSFRATAWLGILGALLGTLLADPLCRLAYGARFGEAAAVFGVLVWVLPISLLSGHARFSLIAYGRQSRELVAQAVGTLVTLGLGALLVTQLGVTGAAWAMLVAALAVWGVAHGAAREVVGGLPLLGPAARPAVAALGAGALGLALVRVTPAGPWLAAGAAALAYTGLALLLERSLLADLRALLAARTSVVVEGVEP